MSMNSETQVGAANGVITFTGVQIRALQGVVPSFCVDAREQLALEGVAPGPDFEQLYTNLGYQHCHMLLPPATTADMMVALAQHLLAQEGLSGADIDTVISVTQTPDYLTPGNSFIYKHFLGLGENCLGFDLCANCTGFLNGLFLGAQLVSSGIRSRVLVLMGDCARLTNIFNRNERDHLICDGGSAVILERNLAAPDLVFSCKSADQFDHNQLPARSVSLSLREPNAATLALAAPRPAPAQLTAEHCVEFPSGTNSPKDNFVFVKSAFLGHTLIVKGLQEMLAATGRSLTDLSLGLCSPLPQVMFKGLNEVLAKPYAHDAKLKAHAQGFFRFLNQDPGHVVNGALGLTISHNLEQLPELTSQPVCLAATGAGLSVAVALVEFSQTHLYPTFRFEQEA